MMLRQRHVASHKEVCQGLQAGAYPGREIRRVIPVLDSSLVRFTRMPRMIFGSLGFVR